MTNQMAPWVPLFIQSMNNNKCDSNPFTTFQFATTVEQPRSNKDHTLVEKPTVRTVVFRDFLCKDKKTNVLTFNTDLRSQKLRPFEEHGGEQYFESCFYYQTTWEQYRFSGQWFILSLKGCSTLNTKILKNYGIFVDRDDGSTEYPTKGEWEAEVIRQWKTLSRSSKSLYRKPAPGSLLTSETRKKLDKIQRGVDGANDDAGLENFGIACLCIDSVDYLNLKDGSGGERRIFERCVERRHSIKQDEDDDEDDEDDEDDDDDDNDNDNENQKLAANNNTNTNTNTNDNNVNANFNEDDDSEDNDQIAMWEEMYVCP